MPAKSKSKKSMDTLDVATIGGHDETQLKSTEEELIETPEEAAFRNRETMNSVLVLLFFSALMFSLPFAAFFGIRFYLGEHRHIYGFPNTCWSVLSAVVTANLVIMGYVFIAYRDNQAEIARNKLKSN